MTHRHAWSPQFAAPLPAMIWCALPPCPRRCQYYLVLAWVSPLAWSALAPAARPTRPEVWGGFEPRATAPSWTPPWKPAMEGPPNWPGLRQGSGAVAASGSTLG